LLVVGITASTARAQEGINLNEAENMFSYNVVELRDQLKFGLRVAFPEQEAFVDEVVAKVDSGELSRAMVNVVFVWARKRNPRIPFPYFEFVMRLLAEKRGVVFSSGA
jgi:lauroyl/myristoyl acyltransferase